MCFVIVDVKNLMCVVLLGVKQGYCLYFMVSGNDVQQVLKVIGDVFNVGFGEIVVQLQQVFQEVVKMKCSWLF